MDDIKYLLKFGERKHLESFQKGNLCFGNAIGYRKIEEELKLKGQGDKLEASSKIFATNLKMIDNENKEVLLDNVKSTSVFHYPLADNIPIFCLFAVYDKDCKSSKGDNKISLTDEIKKNIVSHFPKADSVAIIRNPKLFVKDIENSIKREIKADKVHYFNIDKGYNHNTITAVDLEYFKYLTQDLPVEIVNGGKKYSFHSDYVYRVLFCKDLFFSYEQEYRILIPDLSIDCRTVFNVELSEKIDICSLEDFFSE